MNNKVNPYFIPQENPEIKALNIIEEIGSSDQLPIDVIQIAKDYELDIKFIDDINNEAECRNNYGQITIYVNSKIYSNNIAKIKENKPLWHRFRFTIAHELGHCFCILYRELRKGELGRKDRFQ